MLQKVLPGLNSVRADQIGSADRIKIEADQVIRSIELGWIVSDWFALDLEDLRLLNGYRGSTERF